MILNFYVMKTYSCNFFHVLLLHHAVDVIVVFLIVECTYASFSAVPLAIKKPYSTKKKNVFLRYEVQPVFFLTLCKVVSFVKLVNLLTSYNM